MTVETSAGDSWPRSRSGRRRAWGENHEPDPEFTVRRAAPLRLGPPSTPVSPCARRAPHPRRRHTYPLDQPRPRCPEPGQDGGPAHSIFLFQLLGGERIW